MIEISLKVISITPNSGLDNYILQCQCPTEHSNEGDAIWETEKKHKHPGDVLKHINIIQI